MNELLEPLDLVYYTWLKADDIYGHGIGIINKRIILIYDGTPKPYNFNSLEGNPWDKSVWAIKLS